MNKEKLFEIDINKLDNPFEREKLESLPKDWLVELLVRHLKKEIKVIENCKKSIESINKKLQDDKTIKVVDGKVTNMNDYQIVRLKAIRMKCKEFLNILGDTNE